MTKRPRTLACAAAIAVLVIVTAKPATSATRAEGPPLAGPLATPRPHLGYGVNVRTPERIGSLFAPLGLDWLKLSEEYAGSPPEERLPYGVLFSITCDGMPADLEQWSDHVEAIAVAGRGFVEAYEIGNEPNLTGFWGTQIPNPAAYTEALCEAHARIKSVDPQATVVSAGLAPVGRIQGTCGGWNGNNCSAMDEREFVREMLRLGAGDCLDAFGYHPYGFAYTPETDPHTVSNGFAFRGAEIVHDILAGYGLDRKPIWATELGWLRDPSYDPDHDGLVPGWCHSEETFNASFEWMDLPELQQADYLTRAFQYADENWPWMGAMFVWNLDWYDYGWLCEPARYFSIRKNDGTPLGTPALAYDALAAMEKRPGYFGPRLEIEPGVVTLLADVDEPSVFTRTLAVLNAGYQVLTWTATVASGLELTPTLALTTALQGVPLVMTAGSAGYLTGTFSGAITITATTTDVLDVPQTAVVTLLVVPDLCRAFLPMVSRSIP